MFKGLLLPRSDGLIVKYVPGRPADFERLTGPPTSRIVYVAAHVVADPLADVDPTSEVAIDWEATLAYRRYLWSLGLSVAEAMDTAQRGMGLDWENAKGLIRRSAAEARTMGTTIACGAGTDHLEFSPDATLSQVEIAYEEQCEFVESEGGRVILMASRELATLAKGAEDYVRVYGRILSQSAQPVILHWLGGAFDPHLEGYWGHRDVDAAMDVCLEIIKRNASKVDGIKISLLDPSREIAMRRRLPAGVRLYTGDDFNYPELIKGDGKGFSHALLGIFDAIAPAAAAALRALDEDNTARYDEILAPTVPLSRHIFKASTRFYKTGVVFLAFLNGHQNHFRMVGGLESARSIVHLSELFMLADRAGLIADPERATERMRRVLTLSGIFA